MLQNGIGFFLTWLSLASNLNLAIFLTYEAGVAVDISSTIALIVILAAVVVYFILENFIWQRFLLYLFTPWIVLILALSGSLNKNWVNTSPTRNNIITLIILIIVAIMSITKIVMCVLYHTLCKSRVSRSFCNSSTGRKVVSKEDRKINL